MSTKTEFIEEMFNLGVLVNERMAGKMAEQRIDIKADDNLRAKIESEEDLLVLNDDYLEIINKEGCLIDWYSLDSQRVKLEREENKEDYYHSLIQLKIISDSYDSRSIFKSLTRSSSSAREVDPARIVHSEIQVQPEKGSHIGSSFDEETSEEPDDEQFNQSPVNFQSASLQTSGLEAEEEALSEKKSNLTALAQLQEAQSLLKRSSNVEIINYIKNSPHKYLVEDFSKIFLSRYHFLEGILRNRQELQTSMNIKRVLSKQEKETVSIIGLVVEKNETRNGNLIITVEDPTGEIKILISKNKEDLFKKAKDIVVDEVIGITGNNGDKIIFADNIVWPEIPHGRELKRGDKDEYAIFLSDIHVGSTLFLEQAFEKFICWINGKVGNDTQRAVASKVKYIFITGDLVDGVGIYPGQEEELIIKDLKEQYRKFTRLLTQIPSDKVIILAPGNHDGVHLAEPQAPFLEEYSPDLFTLPNVITVSNPATVNVGKTASFSGFDVLMYHGYSFDYYVSNVESIRNNGGYRRADLIMQFLLKRRHLAPSFTSTPYFPGHEEDPLLIKKIPDFFLSGHIHYSNVANYRGVTLISGSCWQAKTSFQEKLGHEPEPARVPIVNLKTREVKVLKFL